MPKKNFPADILEQALSVLAACRRIDSDIRAGLLTQGEVAEQVTQTQALQTQIDDMELQLIDLRNRRDQRLSGIWDMIKRMRTSVKGRFGDDSSEYEMVGGTRMSERKRGTRKPLMPT